jgi:hypothetical protein
LTRGIFDPIVAFPGVLLEIEELFLSCPRVPDEFSAAIGQVVHLHLRRIAGQVFAVDIGTEGCPLSAEQWQKGESFDGRGNGKPCGLENRRHEISEFDTGVRPVVGDGKFASKGRNDEKGDPGASFVGIGLAPQVMIALHVPMIRRENDPGPPEGFGVLPLEKVEEPSDLGVKEGDLSQVARTCPVNGFRPHLAPPGIGIQRGERIVMATRPIADDGGRSRAAVVPIKIPGGRGIG